MTMAKLVSLFVVENVLPTENTYWMIHLKQKTKRLKVSDKGKPYKANTNQNKTSTAILISVKIIFIMDECYYR